MVKEKVKGIDFVNSTYMILRYSVVANAYLLHPI